MIFRECRSFKNAEEQRTQAKKLLEYALWSVYDIVCGEADIKTNLWGKPYLSDFPQIFFNVTHCSEAVAVIVARQRVGIDAEYCRNYSKAAAKRVCSERELESIAYANDKERAFFRLWTLKESYIKALGVGMSFPMREAEFEVGCDLEIKTELEGCEFRLIETVSGLITAACVMTGGNTVDALAMRDIAFADFGVLNKAREK